MNLIPGAFVHEHSQNMIWGYVIYLFKKEKIKYRYWSFHARPFHDNSQKIILYKKGY